ncbi:MAG: SGNH/GDSL hydrolase family protein [bacterium]
MALTFSKGDMIVFDGDSLTNRRSAGNPDTWPFLRLMNWDKPWTDTMSEMLFCWRPDLQLSFFNAASGGSTCHGMAERFDANVLARKPNWVIASVAGNDMRLGIPLEEYRAVMTNYAHQLRAANCQVLFFAISECGPDYPNAEKFPGRRAYYNILHDIADNTEGVHYIDIGPNVAKKATLMKELHELHTIYSDGGHYNAVGNMIIAGEIMQAFGFVNGG